MTEGINFVIGFADNEPGNKSTEGERKSGLAGKSGDGDTDAGKGYQEEFPVLLPGNPEQKGRYCPIREGDNHEKDDCNLGNLERDRIQVRPRTPDKKRGDKRHGDDGKVLENEDAKERAPLERIDMAPLLEDLHDNCCA
jgi:hypothetical protein